LPRLRAERVDSLLAKLFRLSVEYFIVSAAAAHTYCVPPIFTTETSFTAWGLLGPLVAVQLCACKELVENNITKNMNTRTILILFFVSMTKISLF
jgi:hypothetical protein